MKQNRFDGAMQRSVGLPFTFWIDPIERRLADELRRVHSAVASVPFNGLEF